MMTLAKINSVIERVSSSERRPFHPATAAYLAPNGWLFLEGSRTSEWARVRRLVASTLGVVDVYEGNHDPEHTTKGHGHYDRNACEKIA